MCTVTFIARRHGYLLGMNRDEKLTRPTANPPTRQSAGRRQALFPTEPGGGTWIGVNDAGVTFALINWYAVEKQVAGTTTSRGDVVRQILATATTAEANELLGCRPLGTTNAFRIVGVFPEPGTILEWRWNLSELSCHRHDWIAGTWISSGYDEPGAQRTRGAAFQRALSASTEGSREWLRRLHRSHGEECGPYSHCMHRPDAATVSYTEVEVTSTKATVAYHAGTPCSTRGQINRSSDSIAARWTGTNDLAARQKSATASMEQIKIEGRNAMKHQGRIGIGWPE